MKKEDPNAVKKLKSPEFQNKVRKRVADDNAGKNYGWIFTLVQI